jgi:hypothetical protein
MKRKERRASDYIDSTGLNWVGPNWVGPNWVGPNWVGPNWVGMVYAYLDAE